MSKPEQNALYQGTKIPALFLLTFLLFGRCNSTKAPKIKWCAKEWRKQELSCLHNHERTLREDIFTSDRLSFILCRQFITVFKKQFALAATEVALCLPHSVLSIWTNHSSSCLTDRCAGIPSVGQGANSWGRWRKAFSMQRGTNVA